MRINLYRMGTALGLLAVALGAFGAHALKPLLEANQSLAAYKTAVLYQFIHALLILSIGNSKYHSEKNSKIISYFAIVGTLCFSGSLYFLATMKWAWLGPVTPLGGLLLIGAWALTIFTSRPAD